MNELADGQTLMFSSHRTVVHGDNAAGKTGYIRILKSGCRARGEEKILGNDISGKQPTMSVVSIKYWDGDDLYPWEWAGRDGFISRVSVFDTSCAAVYLTEKTNIACRPLGLDIVDKLVKACKVLRSQLEYEQRSLASNALATEQGEVHLVTAVAKLLTGITSESRPRACPAPQGCPEGAFSRRHRRRLQCTARSGPQGR